MDSQNLGGLIIFQNVRWSGPFLRLLRNVLIILQYYENNFIQTYLYKYILHSRPVRFEQNTTCNSSRQESASINSSQIACREFLHAKKLLNSSCEGNSANIMHKNDVTKYCKLLLFYFIARGCKTTWAWAAFAWLHGYKR